MPKISNIKDNIVLIKGKNNYQLNEYYQLTKNVKGFVLFADQNEAKLLIIGDASELKVNKEVTKIKAKSEVEVHANYFGKIISPFGDIIFPDNKSDKGKLIGVGHLDTVSPSILDRVKLSEPLKTGLLLVETMIPVGKGQRQLIIGDRNTGKTSIAIMAAINHAKEGNEVIYVSIGQKRSSVTSIYNSFVEHKIEDKIITIFSNPDSSAQQFLAPKFGIAMAEALAYKGKNVLIIYDDLTKHANVYREVSLQIGRNPGREAYPTDIFFQHSSLLERAGKFTEKFGKGTITALPIVETVQGDFGTLIPSNVISITDGQIVTSAEKFNAGIFPSIDVERSVSRTGSSVQSPVVKIISKGLSSEYASLAEMAKFSEMNIDVSDELAKKMEMKIGINNLLMQRGFEAYSEIEMRIMIELYKLGALGRLKKPNEFSEVFRAYNKTTLGKKAIAKAKATPNKKEFVELITKVWVPLAKAASGTYGELVSSLEVEKLKGGK